MDIQITDEIENHFEDKNIEFTVGSLINGFYTKNKSITDKEAIMSVFALTSKQAKLCLDIVEEIKTLNKANWRSLMQKNSRRSFLVKITT